MRILSIVESHLGSSYYRQIVPMRAMLDAGYPVTILDSPYASAGTILAHDVIQTLRIASHDSKPALKQIQSVQRTGKRVVVDYDDDLINIPEHNPAHAGVTPSEVIRAIREVDAIVVTNEALAAVYRPYAKKIAIIPNYIDVARWPACGPREGITIGLVGSASHHEDWKLIVGPMRRVREQHPDVQFLVAGYMPDYLAGIATEHIGWQNIDAYQRTVNRIDIGLCPLLQDDFNRRKTPIKSMEYALAGAAVVASPTLYREMVAARGSLARSEQDWFAAIEMYIVDADRRRRDAAALNHYVTTRCDVTRHVHEIHATYRKLLNIPHSNAQERNLTGATLRADRP